MWWVVKNCLSMFWCFAKPEYRQLKLLKYGGRLVYYYFNKVNNIENKALYFCPQLAVYLHHLSGGVLVQTAILWGVFAVTQRWRILNLLAEVS